jgi:hypothetical protein
MNFIQSPDSIWPASLRSLSIILFSLLFTLSNVAAQSSSTIVEYETRIAAPNAAGTLLVDEVIFRWSYDTAIITSGVVTETDLVDFSMKVDDNTPLVGGIFVDEIIHDGIVLDAVSPSIGGNSALRLPVDVIWEFDLDANSGAGELLAFRNAVTIPSSGGFFQVEDTPDSEYQVVTYISGDDKTWLNAKQRAEDLGGYLATITSVDEDLLIHQLVLNASGAESWVGGQQTGSEPEVWSWLNGEGQIPLNGSTDPEYRNWLGGEPNNSGGEDYLAVNLGGRFGWNDEGSLPHIGSFVVEFATGAWEITEYVDGTEASTSSEDPLDQRSAIVTETTVRDIPVPLGPGTVFDIEAFEQEAANVVQAGTTNADFCVAPDPREGSFTKGSGKQGKGNGSANGNNGSVVYTFDKRDLYLSELAGTGTCSGALPVPDEDYATWEDLLAVIDLKIASRYRGYRGKVDLTPENEIDDAIEDVWLVIGVVRSDGVEYDGPVSVIGFPDTFIDYAGFPQAETPDCDRRTDFRSLQLGGTVGAFNEIQNVEGETMIVDTVQCNASWSMTRRTTHVFPIRLDGPGGSFGKENENLQTQLEGIQGTLFQAASCAAPGLSLLQAYLDDAVLAVDEARYYDAVNSLEQLALEADAEDSGGISLIFDNCAVQYNYRGNFVARGLAGAFTIWDRYIHDDAFVMYEIPSQFLYLKPDLRE